MMSISVGATYLAWLAYREGGVSESVSEFEEAVSVLDVALPQNDPVRVLAYRGLSEALRSLARNEEALEIQMQIRRIQEATLSPSHPELAGTLAATAETLRRLGRFDEAVDLLTRALAIRRESYDPTSPLVTWTLNNLGLALQSAGRYHEARGRYLEAVRLGEEAGGPESADIAAPLGNLGYLDRHLGDFESADSLLQRALELGELHDGRDHPRVAATLVNLAFLSRDRGRYQEAIGLLRRVYDINAATLGEQNPALLSVARNLANVLSLSGDGPAALEVLESANEIAESNEDLPADAAELLAWETALAHRAAGDSTAASEAFARAMALMRERAGPESQTVAQFQARHAALVGRQRLAGAWTRQPRCPRVPGRLVPQGSAARRCSRARQLRAPRSEDPCDVPPGGARRTGELRATDSTGRSPVRGYWGRGRTPFTHRPSRPPTPPASGCEGR